ncbi:hypothetical protein GC163_13450 [bacterium]|nr:hypothetical protein [bacterium]
MTFLGKVLVVVHLVMSVLFMAFAGAVYTAQTNWQTKFKTASDQADQARRQATDEANNAKQALDAVKAELETVKNQTTTLQGQVSSLSDENTRLDTENKSLKLALDGQRNIADLKSQEAEERTAEAKIQRARNSELNMSRDEIVANLNKIRDEQFGLDLKYKQLKTRYDELLSKNAIMRGFLASKDLPTDTRQMTVSASPPPVVQGKVVEARKEEKGNRILVEVSLGEDDGLIAGHTMTVYRGDKYLGLIRLEDVRPDRSVGVVVETAPNSTIKVEDNVTTKF